MLIFLASAVSLLATAAQPEPKAEPAAISNQQLIALMPAGTESVMVLRPHDVKEDSPLAHWRNGVQMVGAGDGDRGTHDLYHVALLGAADAVVAAFAWGGSQYEMPKGFGMGNFNERWAIAVKKPLKPLMDRLAAGAGIEGLGEPFELEGVRIFRGRTHYLSETQPPLPKDVFVAAIGDRLLLAANRRDDIEAMVRSASKNQEDIPEQWRAVAQGLDLSAPAVILRRYDPKNSEQDAMSPLNPRHLGGPAKVSAAGLVLAPDQTTVMQLRVITEDASGTERFFQQKVFPTGYFTWDTEPSDNGFRAKLVPTKGKNPYEAGFLLFSFFGPNIIV